MEYILYNSLYTQEHNIKLAIDERMAEIGNSSSSTDYFVTIVHGFSLPRKQVRIDT